MTKKKTTVIFLPHLHSRSFSPSLHMIFLLSLSLSALLLLLWLHNQPPPSRHHHHATHEASTPWPETSRLLLPSPSISSEQNHNRHLLSSNSGDPLAVSKNHRHHWNP